METTIQITLDKQLLDLANKYTEQKKIPISSLFETFLKYLIIDNSKEIELQNALDWFSKPQERNEITEEQIISIVKEVRKEIHEKELSC